MQSVQAEAPAARNQTRPISPEHGPRHTHNSAPHVNINARLHSEKQINMRHAIKTDLRYHNYAHLPTKAHTNALSPTCRRGQPRVCSQDRRKIDKTDIRYQNYAHTTTHTQRALNNVQIRVGPSLQHVSVVALGWDEFAAIAIHESVWLCTGYSVITYPS